MNKSIFRIKTIPQYDWEARELDKSSQIYLQ